MEKNVKRIMEMEEILDEADRRIEALKEAIGSFEGYQSLIRELDRYYTGPEWKEDFSLDEEGKLPAGLKRGVLSEDAVYELLERNREMLEMLNGGSGKRIYDISQEVFGCKVFPGDPSPERSEIMKIREGAVCNLTAIKMCAHNGTHVDAPYHFIDNGKKIDEVDLKNWIGWAYVAEHKGAISAADAEEILRKAKQAEQERNSRCYGTAAEKNGGDCDAARRILVKGEAFVTEEAAKVFAEKRLLLFGNESQTVGPEDAPMNVHLIMLGAEVVLLEGIRLAEVKEGVYMLNAAPINLGGADGAPCRAVLIGEN